MTKTAPVGGGPPEATVARITLLTDGQIRGHVNISGGEVSAKEGWSRLPLVAGV